MALKGLNNNRVFRGLCPCDNKIFSCFYKRAKKNKGTIEKNDLLIGIEEESYNKLIELYEYVPPQVYNYI